MRIRIICMNNIFRHPSISMVLFQYVIPQKKENDNDSILFACKYWGANFVLEAKANTFILCTLNE